MEKCVASQKSQHNFCAREQPSYFRSIHLQLDNVVYGSKNKIKQIKHVFQTIE